MMKRFLSCLALALFLIPAPAEAAPVVTAVAAALQLVFAGAGAISLTAVAAYVAVAEVIVYAAAAAALSYVAKALAPKPKGIGASNAGGLSALAGPTAAEQKFGIQGTTRYGGVVPRSIVVGHTSTAGSLVYSGTWGTVDDQEGAYLVRVFALSDVPIHALVGAIIDGQTVTVNDGTPGAAGHAVPEYNIGGTDYLWIKFYDGTQSTADSYLLDKFGSDPDFPLDSNFKGTGVAYAIVTSLINRGLFASFPEPIFELYGAKLYDPRKDTTVGGSGSHRYDTPSTWEYTQNPIVIAYHIMRGLKYSGSWIYGAQKIVAAQLPLSSWFAGMNECDLDIEDLDEETTDQFMCGGEIQCDLEPADFVEELLKCCNGRMAEVGGYYKVRVGAVGAAVFQITDADLVVTDGQSFEPFPSLSKTVNGITANYPEPGEGWQMKPAPARIETDFVLEDDGRQLLVDVNYQAVPRVSQVQRLMQSALLESRKFRSHVITLPPPFWLAEPLDVLSWTSTRHGYSNKKFEIIGGMDLPSIDQVVSIREVDPGDYDFDPGEDYLPAPIVSIPVGGAHPAYLIKTVDVRNSAITNGKIADGTITADKIAAGTITADEIAAGTITADELAVGTITTDRLNDRSVTASTDYATPSSDSQSLSSGNSYTHQYFTNKSVAFTRAAAASEIKITAFLAYDFSGLDEFLHVLIKRHKDSDDSVETTVRDVRFSGFSGGTSQQASATISAKDTSLPAYAVYYSVTIQKRAAAGGTATQSGTCTFIMEAGSTLETSEFKK